MCNSRVLRKKDWGVLMEKEIIDRLTKLIEEYPESQSKLSVKLGVSRNTLTNWKKKLPDQVKDFLRVAQTIGMYTDDIVHKEEPKEKYSKITEILNDLDEKELIKMEMIIEDAYERIAKRRVTSSASKNTG